MTKTDLGSLEWHLEPSTRQPRRVWARGTVFGRGGRGGERDGRQVCCGACGVSTTTGVRTPGLVSTGSRAQGGGVDCECQSGLTTGHLGQEGVGCGGGGHDLQRTLQQQEVTGHKRCGHKYHAGSPNVRGGSSSGSSGSSRGSSIGRCPTTRTTCTLTTNTSESQGEGQGVWVCSANTNTEDGAPPCQKYQAPPNPNPRAINTLPSPPHTPTKVDSEGAGAAGAAAASEVGFGLGFRWAGLSWWSIQN